MIISNSRHLYLANTFHLERIFIFLPLNSGQISIVSVFTADIYNMRENKRPTDPEIIKKSMFRNAYTA